MTPAERGSLGGTRRKETTTPEQRREWGLKGRRVRDAKRDAERTRLKLAYEAEVQRVAQERFYVESLIEVRSILTKLSESESDRSWTIPKPIEAPSRKVLTKPMVTSKYGEIS